MPEKEEEREERKKEEHNKAHGTKSTALLASLLVVVVVLAAFIVISSHHVPVSHASSSSVSPISNANTSAQFFQGPVGEPMNASFMSVISNLNSQLAEVGARQINGTFIYEKPNLSVYGALGFYVLKFGNGTSTNYDLVPIAIKRSVSANISIEQNGKPTFVYIGAQGCPYCAGMRWAIAIALSRFGNFSKLFYDRSATIDGNIPTIMFNFSQQAYNASTSQPPIDNGRAPYGDANPTPFSFGAYYSSPYINFEPFICYSSHSMLW